MEPTKKPNSLIIGGSVVLILIVIIGAYMIFFRTPKEIPITTIDTGPDIPEQISGAVETPAEKLPETNPFTGYKNPF